MGPTKAAGLYSIISGSVKAILSTKYRLDGLRGCFETGYFGIIRQCLMGILSKYPTGMVIPRQPQAAFMSRVLTG